MHPIARRRSPLLVLLAALLVLCVAAPARAAIFPAQSIDGPFSGDVVVGGVDIARDGTGAVAERRPLAGAPHVFVSLLSNGLLATPVRVDPGIGAASGAPAVTVTNGGGVIVAWASGGSIYTARHRPGVAGFDPPVVLARPNAGRALSAPSVDVTVTGKAYAAFEESGGGAFDVRAARFRPDTGWSPVDGPLDIVASRAAGDGTGRPQLSTSPDGTAIVVWGETGADGRRHVYERRIFGTARSVAPQEASVPSLDGRAGGDADLPSVIVEADSSYAAVAYRERFQDGATSRPRALGRWLRGSGFDPAFPVDGLSFPAGEGAGAPIVAITVRGGGLIIAPRDSSGQVHARIVREDKALLTGRIDTAGGVGGGPITAATGDNTSLIVGWPLGTALRGRYLDHGAPGPEATLSSSAFGPLIPANGMSTALDRTGNGIVAFVQGTALSERLVVAPFDQAPGRPIATTTTHYRPVPQPFLSWNASTEQWGPVTYRANIDGLALPATSATRLQVPVPLPDGQHSWTLSATDRRGQTVTGRPRVLGVDTVPPKVTLAVRGSRKLGSLLRFTVKATDPLPAPVSAAIKPVSSGVRSYLVRYGDGKRGKKRVSRHRFLKPGTFHVRVDVKDAAGNRTIKRATVKIPKPKKKKKTREEGVRGVSRATVPRELRAAGRLLTIDHPWLMGIVNATPDSFSDGGRYPTVDTRVALAAELLEAGAQVIDVGGQSGITGVPEVDPSEEVDRVLPVVEGVRALDPDVLISVDTYKPAVVEAALGAGASIVNDVSGLRYPEVAGICADTRRRARRHAQPLQAQGAPHDPHRYDDVTADVVAMLTGCWRGDVTGAVRRAAHRRPRHRLRQDPGADDHRAAPPGRPPGARTPAAVRALTQGLHRRDHEAQAARARRRNARDARFRRRPRRAHLPSARRRSRGRLPGRAGGARRRTGTARAGRPRRGAPARTTTVRMMQMRPPRVRHWTLAAVHLTSRTSQEDHDL